MAVGRISGPLLKSNLLRNGIDLAFETDLLYLDVNKQRIGIKNANPQYELDVNGTIRATNLIGVCQSNYMDWMSAKNKNADEEKINILISERLEAKKIKDFERADQIRQELLDMNIEIKDGPQGTEWSIK